MSNIYVPGYTEDEVTSLLSESEFYQLCDCPVCGHKYLGKNTVCNSCGFDYYSDNIQEHKDNYNKIISDNPNYMWYLCS